MTKRIQTAMDLLTTDSFSWMTATGAADQTDILVPRVGNWEQKVASTAAVVSRLSKLSILCELVHKNAKYDWWTIEPITIRDFCFTSTYNIETLPYWPEQSAVFYIMRKKTKQV